MPVVAFNGWFLNRPETGTGQYASCLLEALSELEAVRFEVVMPPDSPFRGRLERNLGKVWFEQVRFPARCRALKADVAFVPYFAPPLISPVPVTTTIHDLIPFLFPEYAYSPLVRIYNRLIAASARKARFIVTDSHSSREDVIRILKVPPGKVKVVYPGVGEAFRPVANPATLEAVRKRYGLPERFFLYLGGFDRRKNLGVLLEACAILQEHLGWQGPDLVVAGKLPQRESPALVDPRPLVEKYGLGERVRFIGWVEEGDKPALYNLALAFLYPSRYEGFGLPPLEAMACGCPVLASSASSLPEVIGDAGLLIDPAQPEAWAYAMEKVLLEPELAAALRAKGPVQASKFSWERTAQEVLDLLL